MHFTLFIGTISGFGAAVALMERHQQGLHLGVLSFCLFTVYPV